MKGIDDREQSNGEGGGGYFYRGNTSNSSLILIVLILSFSLSGFRRYEVRSLLFGVEKGKHFASVRFVGCEVVGRTRSFKRPHYFPCGFLSSETQDLSYFSVRFHSEVSVSVLNPHAFSISGAVQLTETLPPRLRCERIAEMLIT